MGKITQHPILKSLINLISRRLITALAFFLGTGLLIVFTNLQSSDGFTLIPKYIYSNLIISLSPSSPSKPHPLPPTLAQWQDNTNSGDYFSQVTTTQVGYLVWSQFPIRVYVESPKAVSEKQAQAWVNGVLRGVQEWSNYLPLTIVEKPEIADITIVRKAPPLQISPGSNIPRARSAQTTYELYTSNKVLSHRFTILLSPSQTGEYLIAAARHEFGHALGIWGHSPLQTDALYFSQVRNPQPISPRDVNTLKLVYEQPTSLGWPLGDNSKIN
ncbi:peptidase [Nostoc edaphicum CCNP1411]|uniref:Peptidase n=1 Tax=Nostoc edaphicum CCNP1411 TaxID=1472755 RepID=A0A7D7QQH2_9NOSO|nr:peptidase [Nostoc edaphicum]QMS90980.1 peptidase [Nostoc edaphicum CCNP1411]